MRRGEDWRCWRCKAWNSPRHRHCYVCGSDRFAPYFVAIVVLALVVVIVLLRSS